MWWEAVMAGRDIWWCGVRWAYGGRDTPYRVEQCRGEEVGMEWRERGGMRWREGEGMGSRRDAHRREAGVGGMVGHTGVCTDGRGPAVWLPRVGAGMTRGGGVRADLMPHGVGGKVAHMIAPL